MKKWTFLWSLAVFTAVMGQENQYEVAVIGFYNLENLFDTDSSMQTINVDKLNAGEVDYVLSETFDVDKYYSSDWVSLYENVSISKSRTDYSKLPEVPVEALRFTKPNKKDYEERTNKKLSQKEFDAMIASDDKWLSKKEFQELIKNNETITVNSKEVVAKVNDFDNTPLGSRQYTAELYQDKLNKLAEVIASLGDGYSKDGAALVGLAEIENEKVLWDRWDSRHCEFRTHPTNCVQNWPSDWLFTLGQRKPVCLCRQRLPYVESLVRVFTNQWTLKYGCGCETTAFNSFTMCSLFNRL